LAKLPFEQREALLLVAAQGFSYEEAAEICGTRLGTIKSRVNRARKGLAELLAVEEPDDIGADRVFKAVLR
jgi:RNA polymerase sigma-70 factor, ECF subfamily